MNDWTLEALGAGLAESAERGSQADAAAVKRMQQELPTARAAISTLEPGPLLDYYDRMPRPEPMLKSEELNKLYEEHNTWVRNLVLKRMETL
jgi:hypothetical protein